jgi:transposase InsO family protein
MKKAFPEFSVTELCNVFGVFGSSFYYKAKTPSVEDEALNVLVKLIFNESGYTYGKRRIQAELLSMGCHLGLYKIANIMKNKRLKAIRPKKKHHYPTSGTEHKYAPTLIKRKFVPETYNTHYVGDITYIRHHGGWSYLACVLDLATKEIVGYALSTSPDAALTKAALDDAIQRQQPDTTKLIFHSDQGVQYSASEFRNRLKTLKITQSMSRRGNCLDNAVMERFFRSLKTERLNNISFINHSSVVGEVKKYISFYNHRRRHSAVGYMTPHQKYTEMKNAA